MHRPLAMADIGRNDTQDDLSLLSPCVVPSAVMRYYVQLLFQVIGIENHCSSLDYLTSATAIVQRFRPGAFFLAL